MRVPTRLDVHAKLLALLRGDEPRETAASWASQWVALDDPGIEDPAVWSAIRHLAGADLQCEPGVYLHDESDIHAWIDELEAEAGL